MIASTLEFVLGNFTLTLFVLGLIASAVRILRAGDARTRPVVTAALLDCFILFSVGISFVYNFVLHSVFGGFTAHIIGWAQSPFQLELAFASLGFGVVGFLAFPRSAALPVKVASVLAITPFLWGAAGGHIYQIITTGNTAAGNSGVILYSDLLLPVFGLAFLWWHHRATRDGGGSGPVPAAPPATPVREPVEPSA